MYWICYCFAELLEMHQRKDLILRIVECTLESHIPATVRRNFLLIQWEVVCEKRGSLGHVNINVND